MKNIFLLLICAVCIMGCTSNDDEAPIENEDTILGRWHLVGFEQTVLYEFTSDLRYTIYSTDGNFGTLDEAIPNPNTWTFENDDLVIDLNFGNFFVAAPNFKCNGNVVDLVAEGGTTTLFREGYDINGCNE